MPGMDLSLRRRWLGYRSMASSCCWAVRVVSAGGSSKTSESRQPPDTAGVEGLRTTPFFGLAPDPDAERLDSDVECRKNIGEELHSHFNYERDTLTVNSDQFNIPSGPVSGVHFSCARPNHALTWLVTALG